VTGVDPDYALLDEDADEVLLGLLARDNEPPPRYTLPHARREPLPQPDFDQAAFLRHMQGLIAKRATAERDAFARERAELDRLLAYEEVKAAPPPPPPPPPPKPVAPVLPLQPPAWLKSLPQYQQAKPTHVELWFDPEWMPTPQFLKNIALYTLNYFVSARRLAPDGLDRLGAQTSHIECARDADAIAGAMKRLADTLPSGARMSARPLEVPDLALGVTLASRYAALRLFSTHSGQSVAIDLTWDA
jgi:hypothetical protein